MALTLLIILASVLVLAELVVLAVLLWAAAVNLIFWVPYVQMPEAGLREVLELMRQAGVVADTKVVDLGAGDGQVLAAIERQFGVVGVGYEISPWPWLLAQWRLRRRGMGSRVHFGDFYRIDLSGYNVVFCFLTQPVMAGLEKKFDRELRLGTRMVLYGSYLPNGKPVRVVRADKVQGRLSDIYIY